MTIQQIKYVITIYETGQFSKAGEKLYLPNALDVPAALGSDTALDILEENPGKSFRAELQPHSDGSFYAVLVLIDGTAEPKPFQPEGAEIRCYTRMETPTIAYTPKEGKTTETETEFVDNKTPSQRYWTVPFIGNGVYKP